jgi:hypothetical protein
VSRASRFLGGAGLGYAKTAVVAFGNLWLLRFLLFRIGSQDYGLWLIALQVATYLLLLDLGVVGVLGREAGHAAGRPPSERRDALARELATTARLIAIQMPLVAACAAAAWWLVPAEWGAVRRPLGIVLAAFVVNYPARAFKQLLLGLQDVLFLELAQIGSWVLSTATTVALVEAGFGLDALAAGWVVQQLSLSIAWLARILVGHPGVIDARVAPEPGAVSRRLRQSLWVSLSQIAAMLLAGTDVFVIGNALGPAAVVPYACTAKLVTTLALGPQMLVDQSLPPLAQLRVADPRRFGEVLQALMVLVVMSSGAVALVATLANQGFVEWWVGAERWGGDRLNLLLAGAMILRHASATTTNALFCLGQERRISLTTLADGALTVAVMSGLVLVVGPLAAPIGVIAGSALVSLPANGRALARETGLGVAGLLAPLGPWSWRFAALCAALLVGSRWWWPTGALPSAAVAAGAAVVYGAIVLPAALRSPLGPYVRARLSALRVGATPVAVGGKP